MSIENLDQIRAQHAVRVAEGIDRKAVTRIAAMIVNNGLLAAAAFADQRTSQGQPQKPEMKKVCDVLADYLRSRGLTSGSVTTAMISDLCSRERTSQDLRLATDEALAYLGFLKRFAAREEE